MNIVFVYFFGVGIKLQPVVLIVDDDKDILELLRLKIEKENLQVITATNEKEALQIISTHKPSLIILDIMMPDANGIEICRNIRGDVDVPIIFLSAKDSDIDKIIGLENGADDYITKPFSTDEVIARIKSHLRREKRHDDFQPKESILEFDHLRINKDTHEIYVDNEKIILSTKEFLILVYLAENKNMVLSREQIFEAVWGWDSDADLNTVTVHLKNIRRKIDHNQEHIKTIWGAGYKFIG